MKGKRFIVKKRPIGTDAIYKWSVYDKVMERVCHIDKTKRGANSAKDFLNRDYGYTKK
jgi:hypothetical protein